MKNRSKPVFFLLSLISVGFIFVYSPKTLADSLTIYPIRQELTIKPGQAITQTLVVRHKGTNMATINVSAEGFHVTDEQYDYKFDDTSDLVKWVVFPKTSISLVGNDRYIFSYTVNVPLGTSPGGKYISIIASMNNQSANSEAISSIDRAASLLYITVPGNNTSYGRLVDSGVPILTISKNINWYIRTGDSGNTQFVSRQTITAINMFGHQVSQTSLTPLILPDTIRLTSGQLSLGNWPGLYRVNFVVGRGDYNAQNHTGWVIYIPPVQTLSLIAAIFAAVWLFKQYLKLRKTPKIHS